MNCYVSFNTWASGNPVPEAVCFYGNMLTYALGMVEDYRTCRANNQRAVAHRVCKAMGGVQKAVGDQYIDYELP